MAILGVFEMRDAVRATAERETSSTHADPFPNICMPPRIPPRIPPPLPRIIVPLTHTKPQCQAIRTQERRCYAASGRNVLTQKCSYTEMSLNYAIFTESDLNRQPVNLKTFLRRNIPTREPLAMAGTCVE